MKKTIAVLLICLSSNYIFGQTVNFFTDIEPDSSCLIFGTYNYFSKPNDTASHIGFLIDNPAELLMLRKEWAFQKSPASIYIEEKDIALHLVQHKKEAQQTVLVFPRQKIINIRGSWYYLDMKKYRVFFENHAIQYGVEKRVFEKYTDYTEYESKVLPDTTVLFFFEPNLSFEGKFTLISKKAPYRRDANDAMSDINRELSLLAPKKSFSASLPVNKSLDIITNEQGKVEVTVQCAKSLYDCFTNSSYIKSSWMPSPIEITIFRKRKSAVSVK